MRKVAVLTGAILLLTEIGAAQPTNGSVTLLQESLTSGGGALGADTPTRLVSGVGQSAGGWTTNGVVSILGGVPNGIVLQWTPGSRTITVTGTVNEEARVEVNGIAAMLEHGTFTADGVPIVEGPNVIVISATDLCNNRSETSLTVFLSTKPPARPTLEALPALTTQANQTLSGTKTAGTSIWMNGREIVGSSDATTWTAAPTLVEGDNDLTIVARDASGNESASVMAHVIVDNLPPVVTFQPPAKTNISPMLLSGSVDDSRTTVIINGLAATRTERSFQLTLPLSPGPNPVHLIATSPNGYVTTLDATITLGTAPRIDAVEPRDGSFVAAGSAVMIQMRATDPEGDPMTYQVSVDGTPLGAWSDATAQAWTPGLGQLGLHTMTVNVRDEYGGVSAQQFDVFVIRPPIEHP